MRKLCANQQLSVVFFVGLFYMLAGCGVNELYPIVEGAARCVDGICDSNSDVGNGTDPDTASETSSGTDTVGDTGEDTGEDTGGNDTDTTSGLDSDTWASEEPFVGSTTQKGLIPDDFTLLWDHLTPENEGRWGVVESERDSMNWDAFDAVYSAVSDAGLGFRQHVFVWGEQSPYWINNVADSEQGGEVEEWISAFCTRYPNIEMINVVSAPMHTPPSYADAIGGEGATGYDWVVWLFERARAHCKNSKLMLNDFNVLRWNTDQYMAIAKVLKARGLLDAVGCEAHGLETISVENLRENLNTVATLGLPIYITEYDIALADDNDQLAVMQEQFPIFYSHPSVQGITFWGYVEDATFFNDAFLRYSDGRWRPALTWLMSYLGRN